MKKIKLYRRILLIELGILATLILHYFVTQSRGYKAIGGEFLLIPLVVILYGTGKAVKLRIDQTNEYFRKKEAIEVYEENRKFYAK